MADSEVALKQRYGLFKYLDLAIEDDDLILRYRVWRNEYPRRVPLADIDPHVGEGLIRSAWCLYGAVLCVIAALVSFAMALLGDVFGQLMDFFWVGSALGWCGGAVVLLGLYLLTGAEYIWLYNRSEGALFLALNARRPTRETVRSFVERLQQESRVRHERLREQILAPAGAYKAACEIEKSHTLLQAGVLDPEAFETKKRALMRRFLSGAMKAPDDDQAIAQVVQNRAFFRRCTFTLYPDRLERFEEGPLSYYRGFSYLGAFPEQPDKRALPPYGRAFAFSFGFFAGAGMLLILAIANMPQDSGSSDYLPTVLGVFAGLTLAPFPVTWVLRRRPIYVLRYGEFASPVSGRHYTAPMWWIRDGRPTHVAVEAFLKAFARAHRDYHDDYRTPQEIFDKFQSLFNRDILSEEEIHDVFARLSRRPQPRSSKGGWGIAPSLN